MYINDYIMYLYKRKRGAHMFYYSKTLMGYMDYIARHDAYRQKNPLRPKKVKKPPKKGTKGYKRYIKNEKKKEKRKKVRNVLNLINSLSAAG